MSTIFPQPLKKGDKIALVSPAGKIKPAIVHRGASLLQQEGFEVAIGKHALNHSGVFAGKDQERIADFQQALDDPSVRAIIFNRGGYGSLRTFMGINWDSFLKNPKWLVGFSDITVFHSYLNRKDIATVHGVMPAFFETGGKTNESFRLMLDLLNGKYPWYHEAPHPLNRNGVAQGKLVGGNLSILQSLRGTPLDFDPKGSILFLEDIGEHHYQLDRMMMNLKASGILEQLNGIVAGHFTDMKDGGTKYGMTSYEIIREAVEAYDCPVLFGLPAGHELPCYPLILGATSNLDVSSSGGVLKFKS